MKDIILRYIKKEFSAAAEYDLRYDDDLLGSGIIDSVNMMKLVLFLEKEFQINIEAHELTVENFLSVEHISTFIAQR